ncbi:MAG: PP2C family protein-serine/threonine phosphatase [Planctomycetota bacterium]|jgi:serine phosphatase RsbU (regulator of sigma subunit)
MAAPRGSFSGNYAFHVACGVALYSVSAFALLTHLEVAPVYTCLAAALTGLGVAVLGRALGPPPPMREEEEEPGDPEPRGFAATETREERASRDIQSALLPKELPAIDGYHVDVQYEPCGNLGGDFYDCIPCSDGRILFTLGDVSGKGAASAIVMAMVQTLFRQNLPRAHGPADLLARVNDGFAGTLGKGVFVTAQAAILDPARHRLTLAAAGHPPLLLLNPDLRRASEVRARGLALGIIGGVGFRDELVETSIDLAPGDSLLFYTDGAVESDAELSRGVGESRLLAAAAASLLPGPDDALHRLREDLWSDGGRRDDTTLLLVTRRGVSRTNPEVPAERDSARVINVKDIEV